ncbi:DUF1489 family protein [Lichenicoccus sp.]|uniref:DUF1489 family protein n=1 Tax=Lichenicoccus sp. TaxID=2781899 RepID=UPI003D131F0A
MLHLIKLAVGVADIETLARRQADRARDTGAHGGQPFLRTRNNPRRAAEILDGGSLYWVMSGVLLCRQLVAGMVPDRRDDGSACIAIILAGPPVPVLPRLVRAFQGWRYLASDDAPADLGARPDAKGDVLPVALQRELAALCLL